MKYFVTFYLANIMMSSAFILKSHKTWPKFLKNINLIKKANKIYDSVFWENYSEIFTER